MSVLKNKRGIARTEFENTFTKLYQYSAIQTKKVSKRRRKWLSYPIDTIMNRVYRNLMNINDGYFRSSSEKENFTSETAIQAISDLNSLDKPLVVLWNVEKYETRKMNYWTSLIAPEVELLNQMHKSEDILCNVMVLDWDTIKNVKFLDNMSKLHRYTHGKVVNAKGGYDDTEGSLLIELVDDAFYEVLLANRKIPATKHEYELRRKHISKAITCLNEMNRPLLFFYNLMQYSERIQVEWAEMLTSELKMLSALQKSDKKRFQDLE